jgi:hypothetical protein
LAIPGPPTTKVSILFYFIFNILFVLHFVVLPGGMVIVF